MPVSSTPRYGALVDLALALATTGSASLALELFGLGLSRADDGRVLAALEELPVSTAGAPWLPLAHHRLERDLGKLSLEAFERAGAVLLRYEVYGPRCMHSHARFRAEGRAPRPGDRIVQRAHLLHQGNVPLVTVPSLVEVDLVEDSPSVKALGYATTRFHVGLGRWRAWLRRADDGACTLTIESWSRPRGLFIVTTPLFRFFQLRARDEAVRRLEAAVATQPG